MIHATGLSLILAAGLLAGCAMGTGETKAEVEAVVEDEGARSAAAAAARKGADTEQALEAGEAAAQPAVKAPN